MLERECICFPCRRAIKIGCLERGSPHTADELCFGQLAVLLNDSFGDQNWRVRRTAFGRLPTDLLLRTCHSARRTRDRRHPANVDSLLTMTAGS
jgi:hypothetical protein